MTQEEKARAYDKAIEKIKYVMEHGVSPVLTKEDLQDIFPELKESEDEKTCKWIIAYLNDEFLCADELLKPKLQTAIAWLEKQGEQKPTLRERYDNIAKSEWFKKTHEGMSISDEETKWSEEDDDDAWLNDIVSKAENGCLFNRAEIDWLKSIKEKLHKQKPKWTEEDERNLTIVEEYLDGFQDFMEEISALIDWLKSLKQRME